MTLNTLRKPSEVSQLRRFKIAIFEEACAGGSGRHVADLASSLAAEGHDVHLLYSSTHIDGRFRAGLAQFQNLNGKPISINIRHNVHPSDIRAVVDVRKYLLRQGPFDLFHIHSTKAGLVGRLAALGLPMPILYTPHAFLTMSPVCDPVSYRGADIIERTLSPTTDIFICVSEEEVEHARSLGIPENKIRMIPNGICVWEANEFRTMRETVRQELGLSNTDICIGSVGRLVDQKASHVLIEAFGIAAPQLAPNVKLIIVGSGPQLPRLETIVRKLRLADRIQFVGELPGLRTMSAFDVYALSSCYEGHPYTFIEALALGLPIVTTAVGGAKMSVQDGVNGFRSPVGDTNALAQSILKVSISKTLREQMSRSSLRNANEFSLQSMMTRISEVYEGTVKTSGKLARSAGAGS